VPWKGYVAGQQGYHFAYRKALADRSGGHADDTHERRLLASVAPDFLIFDDCGLGQFTPQQGEYLYELVCQRDRHKSWVPVSNRLTQDGYPLVPNPVLAEGIPDRLVNTSCPIVFEGKSFRSLCRPGVTASDPV
jgi:DNA replication protein DnaC